jgi:hypothetical protein
MNRAERRGHNILGLRREDEYQADAKWKIRRWSGIEPQKTRNIISVSLTEHRKISRDGRNKLLRMNILKYITAY